MVGEGDAPQTRPANGTSQRKTQTATETIGTFSFAFFPSHTFQTKQPISRNDHLRHGTFPLQLALRILMKLQWGADRKLPL